MRIYNVVRKLHIPTTAYELFEDNLALLFGAKKKLLKKLVNKDK